MTELAELVLEIRRRVRDMSGVEPYGSDEPPTASEIAEVEQQLGFKLPEELREIYAVCNGSALGAASLLPVSDLLVLEQGGKETLIFLTVEQEPGLTPSGESGVMPQGPVAFFMYRQPIYFAVVRSGPDRGRLHCLDTGAIDAEFMTGEHVDSWEHVAWSMSDYLRCFLELLEAGLYSTRIWSDGHAMITPTYLSGEPFEDWLAANRPSLVRILNKRNCGLAAMSLVGPSHDHLRQELTWHEHRPS